MIKWHIEPIGDEISIVSSSWILKLATKNINSYPVVATFLNFKEKSTLSTLYCLIDFDETKEIDFHGLLKQIEGIGSVSVASKNEFLKDTLFGVSHGIVSGT